MAKLNDLIQQVWDEPLLYEHLPASDHRYLGEVAANDFAAELPRRPRRTSDPGPQGR